MSWARPEEANQWQRLFGDRLKELRLREGYSQMSLAHASDMHPTYTSSVERGGRNVSLSTLHVLAASLGVSVAEFFPPTVPPEG